MASERPIRRKPCSHANNFESLIAFRNTYVWGGGGDGGRRGWGRFQWFSGCKMLTVIFFSFFPSRLSYFSLSIYLSLYLSLSSQPRKKKNACTRTPKFLCIFLKNARPPPPPPPHTHMSPHTNGNSFKSFNTSLSSRWWGRGGGVGAWPPTGYRRCLNKRGDERPLNSVLQP